MIQELLRRSGSGRPRLAVGLLLVLALAFLSVAGAVHVAHADHDSGHAPHGVAPAPCTVCDAVLASAGAAIPAPPPGVAAVGRCALPVPDLVLLPPLVSEPGRVAPPRGPPARS